MTVNEMKNNLKKYADDLRAEEKAEKTIKAYTTDIEMFIAWTEEKNISDVDKNTVIEYKADLTENKSTATANRRIVSLNKYFTYLNVDLSVKAVKQQTANNSIDNIISVSEYERLLKMALTPSEQATKAGLKPDKQAYMIMVVLANTGIRISELQYFTVESLAEMKKSSCITAENKGKIRQVPISNTLYKMLKDYCKEKNITNGYLFGTRNGNCISDEQITRRLKKIAGYCRIRKDKVHCHSFRHLFGKVYMDKVGKIDELADILGHSSINTTRIYSRTTNKEKASNINKLDLI